MSIAGTTFGQDHELTLGLRGGYTNTIIDGSYVERRTQTQSGMRAPVKSFDGFEIAITLQYQIYKPIFVSTGVGLIRKGGSIEDSNPTYPVDITLNYLTIPVEVAVRAVSYKRLSAFASAGIVFNYEISSQQDFKKGLAGQPTEAHTFIPSYTGGLSLRYRINDQISVQADAKFFRDITPFFEETFSGDHYDMITKGKAFSAGIVYTLK